jgi:hypothetical protein
MLDNKYIPVEIYAEERRIPPEYVIKKIRKGDLVGRIYHNQWYLDLERSPSLSHISAKEIKEEELQEREQRENERKKKEDKKKQLLIESQFQQRKMQKRKVQLDNGLLGFLCGVGQQVAVFIGAIVIIVILASLSKSLISIGVFIGIGIIKSFTQMNFDTEYQAVKYGVGFSCAIVIASLGVWYLFW